MCYILTADRQKRLLDLSVCLYCAISDRFCPSVFLYLSSVVPAIWLLELDKVDRRLRAREEAKNITAFSIDDLRGLDKIMGVSAHTYCSNY
jgi:hypothetical protein